ncbi:MAG: CoA-binding protein [Patescibacteria group bacterium]
MKSVAIVGASNDRRKYGNKAVRAYRHQGWTVYPVNPNEQTIEGVPVYRSVRDIPGTVSRVSMYLPPAVGMTVLREIAAIKPAELFLNPGSENPELLQRATSLGMHPVVQCSIREIGENPANY